MNSERHALQVSVQYQQRYSVAHTWGSEYTQNYYTHDFRTWATKAVDCSAVLKNPLVINRGPYCLHPLICFFAVHFAIAHSSFEMKLSRSSSNWTFVPKHAMRSYNKLTHLYATVGTESQNRLRLFCAWWDELCESIITKKNYKTTWVIECKWECGRTKLENLQ